MLFNEAAHCVEIHLRKVSFFQLCLFIILPRIVKSLNYQNSSKVQKLPKSPKSKFVKITLMIKIHHFMRYFVTSIITHKKYKVCSPYKVSGTIVYCAYKRVLFLNDDKN